MNLVPLSIPLGKKLHIANTICYLEWAKSPKRTPYLPPNTSDESTMAFNGFPRLQNVNQPDNQNLHSKATRKPQIVKKDTSRH